MFFFFFSNEENGGVTTSLIGEVNENEANFNDVRASLQKESEKQGLRNNDLAELTGWSTSKTSKITAGKQKMTSDDVRTWSRSLGFTPDPFVDKEVDFRYYSLSSYVRPISDILESYFDTYDNEVVQKAIVNYELPLSIMSVLGVNASEYAVRADTSYYGINPDSKHGFGSSSTYVKFWQRTTHNEDSMTPEFGIWISPNNDYFLFVVYLHRNSSDNVLPQLRIQYKDALQIDDKDMEEFDVFAIKNREWIPEYVRKGEIFAYGAETNYLPDAGHMETVFIDMFKKYCSLVWEVKGIDLLPDRLKEIEGLSPFQQLDILNGYADFNIDVKEKVKSRENFTCENDKAHVTFRDKEGLQYMDVVPLVPFNQGQQYGKSILSEDNAMCLCPMCKAQMKYGTDESREDIVIKLYRKHKEGLQKNGIELSLAQVLAANNLV